jgi:hypothetical protein
MANKYGEAALIATLQPTSTRVNPGARWEHAMDTLYPTSPTARKADARAGSVEGD